MAPFYIIFLFIYLFPLIETFCYSFTDFDLFNKPNLVGLRNYIRAFSDEYFLIAIKNTLIYVVFNVIIIMVLGLLLAELMNSKLVNTKFARLWLFLPHVSSMVAVSMIWIWLYDPIKGFINYMLRTKDIKWLSDPELALASIIIMSI